jgi:8-oxo-dGTP pyrophosphatase MutT (NUDIX family)
MGSSGLEVVFTLRTTNLSTHGGQVSFPGGRVETSDRDRWETALREMEEEVGVSSHQIEPLGIIDEYHTITHYHVTPCVGLLSPDAVFIPEPAEVEEVFAIPLATFRDPARVRTMRSTRAGHSERIWFYLTSPHIVWGATAAMLTNLLEVLEPTVD